MGRGHQARRDQVGIVHHSGAERRRGTRNPYSSGQRIWISDLPFSRQSGMTSILSWLRGSTHIVTMAKGPDRPRAPQRRDPAKHSKKDPAKPTRAKAARPDAPVLDPSLADLLNPGIGQGRAGIGAQTGETSPSRKSGLQPPPDNSWARRANSIQTSPARSESRRSSRKPKLDRAGRSNMAKRQPPDRVLRGYGVRKER